MVGLQVCNGFDCLRLDVRIDASTLSSDYRMTDLVLFRRCFTLTFNLMPFFTTVVPTTKKKTHCSVSCVELWLLNLLVIFNTFC